MSRSIVLVFLLTLGAVQAHASYLFGLTDKEIDEVMTYYYPKGYDREAALRQMSEPFDCRSFGDLCTDVGERYALRMLESAWTKGRRRYPIEMIAHATEQELEYYGQLWFDSRYSQGVPEKDPYWVGDASGTECTGSGVADSGDFRVIHTSHRHSLVVFAWGRVKVEHFKKNLLGNYELKKADKLQVEGTIFFKSTSAIEPFSVDVGDEKEDAKRVAAWQPNGGAEIVSVPFVEGCGGVPGTLLWACSCIGTQP